MRATVYDGRGSRRVELAPWVKLHALSAGADVFVRCERCGGRDSLGGMGKADAEKALGRFASWHGRCGEKPLAMVSVRAHYRGKPVFDIPVTYVRRKP